MLFIVILVLKPPEGKKNELLLESERRESMFDALLRSSNLVV